MKKLILLLLLTGPFILELNAQTPMTFDWAKNFLGGFVSAYHIVQDANNDLIIAGAGQNISDLDPGPGIHAIPPVSSFASYVVKLDKSGNFIWATPFPSIGSQGIVGMKLLPNQDIILTVTFFGTLYAGTDTLVATSTDLDFAVLRISSSGQLMWARHIKGTRINQAHDLAIDETGSIFLCGIHSDTTDFDPDPVNKHLVVAQPGSSESFLLKMNQDGSFQSVITWPTSELNQAITLAIRQNEIYIAGDFQGATDFDPGPGQFILSTTSTRAAFIVKLTSSFQFQWAQKVEGAGRPTPRASEINHEGDLVIVGNFNGEIDLDPGSGVLQVTGSPTGDIYFQKFSPQGALIWANSLGATEQESVRELVFDQNDAVYAVGHFGGTVDFDPGADVFLRTADGVLDAFIIKLNRDGVFQDAKTFGSSAFDQGYSCHVDNDFNVFIAGICSPQPDFDPGAPYSVLYQASPSGFLNKLTQGYHYTGNVFRDLNENGQADPGEPALNGAVVAASQRQGFATTNDNGEYTLHYNLENDTIFLRTPPYWTATPAFYAISAQQNNLNFAVSGPLVKDISVTAVEQDIFRPSFSTRVVIQVRNIGGLSVSNLELHMNIVTPSTGITYLNSVPSATQILGNEIRWNIPELGEGELLEYRVNLQNASSVPVGTPVKLGISCPFAEDLNLTDNNHFIESETLGSFDPNDKRVTPAKVTPEGLDSTLLRYVVRFQNTGTFPADRVIIRDTLPTGIDISTLRVMGYSHPCTWRIYDGRLLEFDFNPIFLPDSTSNEPASKGFVVFSVKPQPGLALGDSVRNRVGIYFDFNAPVITNYATMKMVQTVGATEPGNAPALEFQISPNPAAAKSVLTIDFPDHLDSAADIQLFDAQGRTVQTLQLNKGEKQLTLPDLAPGSYFVQVRAGGRVGGKVLVIH